LTVLTSPDRSINVFEGWRKNNQLPTGSAEGVSPLLNRNVVGALVSMTVYYEDA
jgi:hypothetical protein